MKEGKKAGKDGKRVCGIITVVGCTPPPPSTLTCSTQTPELSSGAQMIMVLSMEAESRLRGCCSSPPVGGDREPEQTSIPSVLFSRTYGNDWEGGGG